MTRRLPNLVSLFSGALGMDVGLEQAGFETSAIVECDTLALSTIRNNVHQLRNRSPLVISERLTTQNVGHVCRTILDHRPMLTTRGVDLVAGAPPCQPFSTVGKRLSIQDARASGFDIMFEAIRVLQPRAFIIENVAGVISAALRHRPLCERGPGFARLLRSEEYGSGFRRILRKLGAICSQYGYCATWGILNAADFGVPQTRRRLVIIGSQLGYSLWPTPTHAKSLSDLPKWLTLKDALEGLEESDPLIDGFTGLTRKFISHVPPGGNWRDLPPRLRREALGEAYKSWGGRSGFLRRLAWDQTPPTVTYSPSGRATLLCHPDLERPLTVRECARLQGFPDNWLLAGGVRSQCRQVGNATPIGLAKAIGLAILKAERQKHHRYEGKVLCAQPDLVAKIGRRRRTILNPASMRPGAALSSDRTWLGRSATRRTDAKLLRVRPTGAKQ